jgi:hypothetical protein
MWLYPRLHYLKLEHQLQTSLDKFQMLRNSHNLCLIDSKSSMRYHVAYQFFFDPKRGNPWSIKLGLLPKLIYSSRFGNISGGGDGGKMFGGGGGGGRSSKSVCPSEPVSVFCSFPEPSPPDESGELLGEAGEVDEDGNSGL